MQINRSKILQRGFTLVEMSIVLLILGLVIGSSASYYGLYLKKQNAEDTARNIDLVTEKIAQFRNVNGRYPKPASLTSLRGDADYGRENTTVCGNVAKLPGTCESGVCIKSSSRDINNDLVNETLRVCEGTIPFRQLDLPEDYAFDGYGSRLVYAVTEDMTDDIKFKATIGGIEILKAQGTVSALDLPASAHFVLLSLGANRAGGFTADGVQLPCPATGAENTNCNTGAAATFRIAQVSTATGDAQFDDSLNFFIRDPAPLWQISSDATAKMQGDMIMKPGDSLAVKLLSTNTTEVMPDKAVINGVLRASDKVISSRLCDRVGAGCFSASLFAGPLGAPNDGSGLKCPDDDIIGDTGPYMVAIEEGRPVCKDEVAAVCGNGDVMIGVNGAGEIQCAPYVPSATCANCCPSFETNICGRPYTVPSLGAYGTVPWPGPVIDVYDTGGTGGAWEYWTCYTSGWQLTASNYSCAECVPVAEEYRNFGCGQGFTGNDATYRIKLTCPGYAISFLDVNAGTAIPVSTNCQCVEETQTKSVNCPGNTGIYNASRRHYCNYYNPATHSGAYWTDWDYSGKSSCPCTEGTVTKQQLCPSGSGYIQLEGTRSCPDGYVSNWHEVSNNCGGSTSTCDPSQTEDSAPQACPTGYTANPTGIINRRQRDCSTGGWYTWYQYSNDCVAGSPSNYQWKAGSPLNSIPRPTSFTIKVGDSCTYGSALQPCYSNTPSNAYEYKDCACGLSQ